MLALQDLWGYQKNRHCQRCCATATCSMKLSHSTHCNSCGYDLISLAAVLWHHTAALGGRAQLWESHRAPRDVAKALRLSHSHVACATHLLHRINLEAKKGIMYKSSTHHNPQSWLCAFQSCTYFVICTSCENSLQLQGGSNHIYNHIW